MAPGPMIPQRMGAVIVGELEEPNADSDREPVGERREERVAQLRPHGPRQGVAIGGGVEGQRRDAGRDGDLQH